MCASCIYVSPVFFGAKPEADVSQIALVVVWDFGPINSMIEKVAGSLLGTYQVIPAKMI